MNRAQWVIVALTAAGAVLLWFDSWRREQADRDVIVRPHRDYVRLALMAICPNCEVGYERDLGDGCPRCGSRAEGFDARRAIEPLEQAAQTKARAIRTGKLKVIKGRR